MLLAEISMWPMDKGESVGAHVAEIIDLIDRSGLSYKLGPLGTCIEGEWDEVMAVCKQCFDHMSQHSNRIACSMKMDWRRGRSGSLTSKVRSVEQKLGREVQK